MTGGRGGGGALAICVLSFKRTYDLHDVTTHLLWYSEPQKLCGQTVNSVKYTYTVYDAVITRSLLSLCPHLKIVEFSLSHRREFMPLASYLQTIYCLNVICRYSKVLNLSYRFCWLSSLFDIPLIICWYIVSPNFIPAMHIAETMRILHISSN